MLWVFRLPDLDHYKRIRFVQIWRKCRSVEVFLKRNILVNEELSVFRVDPRAGFQRFVPLSISHSLFLFGLGETSANIEPMDQSDALEIVRALYQRKTCKVVRKVNNVF